MGWFLLSAPWLFVTGCGGGGEPPAETIEGSPLSLDAANPRYLLFRGEATALVGSTEHYGSVLNGGFDYVRYLDEIADRGLNLTRTFSGSYFELPDSVEGIGADSPLAPAPEELIVPWPQDKAGSFDLDAWNPAYFERLRDFVAAAGERDIVVELTLFSTIYDEARWGVNPFNPANNAQGAGPSDLGRIYTLDNGGALEHQDALVRELVTELNGYDNVYYEVINEPWLEPAPASDEWQEHIAATIQRTESRLPNEHLIARNYNHNAEPPAKPDPAISIHNFHYRRDLSPFYESLDGALALDETGLQGAEPEPYRADAWYFMLGGGAIFDNLDWSFAPGFEDGSFDFPAATPGGGGAELRRQLGVLAGFLDRLDLGAAEPRSGLILRRPEGASVQLLGDDNAYGLYMSGGGSGSIGLDLHGGRYDAEWIDPASGRTLRSEQLRPGGDELTLSPPPHDFDVALYLERKGGSG